MVWKVLLDSTALTLEPPPPKPSEAGLHLVMSPRLMIIITVLLRQHVKVFCKL